MYTERAGTGKTLRARQALCNSTQVMMETLAESIRELNIDRLVSQKNQSCSRSITTDNIPAWKSIVEIWLSKGYVEWTRHLTMASLPVQARSPAGHVGVGRAHETARLARGGRGWRGSGMLCIPTKITPLWQRGSSCMHLTAAHT